MNNFGEFLLPYILFFKYVIITKRHVSKTTPHIKPTPNYFHKRTVVYFTSTAVEVNGLLLVHTREVETDVYASQSSIVD